MPKENKIFKIDNRTPQEMADWRIKSSMPVLGSLLVVEDMIKTIKSVDCHTNDKSLVYWKEVYRLLWIHYDQDKPKHDNDFHGLSELLEKK
jgi:hypothetical protein